MKSFYLLLLLLTSMFLISGCNTTGGPSYSDYEKTIKPPAAGDGRIWFYRPSKSGSEIQPIVMIGKAVAGKAQNGCFFFVDRMPGDYEILSTSDWKTKITVHLNAGDEKYVRLGYNIGMVAGYIVPVAVSRDAGLKEIQHCNLLTADGANANVLAK